LDEIPSYVVRTMTIHLVDTLDKVLHLALSLEVSDGQQTRPIG
jgi:ATP-dependent Lon protease